MVLLGSFSPQIFGVGYESIELALFGKIAIGLVSALIFVKILATSLTLGSGGSGGVFAPSLFIGAMLGEAYGKLTQFLIPNIALPAGACALVGMGAVFAGAAQAPISAIIIIFEMSGNYKIILPLMITCIISTVVVRQFSKESIYTLKLRRRGIDIQKFKELDLIEMIKVSEAMVKSVITVDKTITVREADLMIKSTHPYRVFPVIDPKGKLVGMITRKDISKALDSGKAETIVKEIMTKDIIVCYPDENLKTALQKLGERDIGRIPVVKEGSHSHLIGLITREGIIDAYNQAVQKKEAKPTIKVQKVLQDKNVGRFYFSSFSSFFSLSFGFITASTLYSLTTSLMKSLESSTPIYHPFVHLLFHRIFILNHLLHEFPVFSPSLSFTSGQVFVYQMLICNRVLLSIGIYIITAPSVVLRIFYNLSPYRI